MPILFIGAPISSVALHAFEAKTISDKDHADTGHGKSALIIVRVVLRCCIL